MRLELQFLATDSLLRHRLNEKPTISGGFFTWDGGDGGN